MAESGKSPMDQMVRVGTVSSVNEGERTARVEFADKVNPFISGPLIVLKSTPFIPTRHVTQETNPRSGGTGESAFTAHTHEVIIAPWLPEIGQMVVCLFPPNGDGDGFVIGGL